MTSSNGKGLRFPCDCVSALGGGYTDPWADIAKRKLMPNGTKEQILTHLADEPKTISQLALALNLSAPSIFSHINDMLKSELLRESKEFEKKHPSEHYYEPNFPVFKAEACAEFRGLCDEITKELTALFEKHEAAMEQAFLKTNLPAQGWQLSDVTQCIYANVYRGARSQLEERGLLASRVKHSNGAEWIFWAEEHEQG
jgi:DNA-binding transcriptional ArsR family regulator